MQEEKFNEQDGNFDQPNVSGRFCVFCEEVCENAPTERGWSEVLKKNGSRQGLHFDCARKVAHQADIIDEVEKRETLR